MVPVREQTRGANDEQRGESDWERTRLACTFRWLAGKHSCFGEPPKPQARRVCSPELQTGRFCITSYLQLRESDLLGLECFRSVASSSSHSSFCEEVFSRAFKERRASQPSRNKPTLPKPSLLVTSRMRWTGQIFWLLAYDACAAPHLLPPSPPKCFRRLAQWEVVSSYSSATAPDSHGISCADPLFQARKEPGRALAACAWSVKII